MLGARRDFCQTPSVTGRQWPCVPGIVRPTRPSLVGYRGTPPNLRLSRRLRLAQRDGSAAADGGAAARCPLVITSGGLVCTAHLKVILHRIPIVCYCLHTHGDRKVYDYSPRAPREERSTTGPQTEKAGQPDHRRSAGSSGARAHQAADDRGLHCIARGKPANC